MNAIKTTHSRGANAVDAQPQRIESANGKRWATGRNVKAETSNPSVFTIVQAWTLKERDASGKAVVVAKVYSRQRAIEWVTA